MNSEKIKKIERLNYAVTFSSIVSLDSIKSDDISFISLEFIDELRNVTHEWLDG